MYALWGLGLRCCQDIVVVSARHVHDLSEVAWRATGSIDPRRDLDHRRWAMDDHLDHAACATAGGKLGVDATERAGADGIGQPWPEEISMSEDIRALVTRRWAEYGL
jgi:4-hydroxy-3-polyprenylbenzoate decarboxylase